MKIYLFEPFADGRYIDVKVDGKLTYRWPSSGPDLNFTSYLIAKLLSPRGAHRVLVRRQVALVAVEDNALDFYLPPAYRPLPRSFPKLSLWRRFINLFTKKENYHARTQHNRRTQ